MSASKTTMDEASHLILHLTPKTELKKGITVIAKGEEIAKGSVVKVNKAPLRVLKSSGVSNKEP